MSYDAKYMRDAETRRINNPNYEVYPEAPEEYRGKQQIIISVDENGIIIHYEQTRMSGSFADPNLNSSDIHIKGLSPKAAQMFERILADSEGKPVQEVKTKFQQFREWIS